MKAKPSHVSEQALSTIPNPMIPMIGEDPVRYAKYPCRDGKTLRWPDGSVARLDLSEDQTVRIRSCGFPTAHPEINRGIAPR